VFILAHSGKRGSITPYPNKKYVPFRNTKAVVNNHETQHVYVTVHRCSHWH